MHSCSSFLSHSTLAAITCTCTALSSLAEGATNSSQATSAIYYGYTTMIPFVPSPSCPIRTLTDGMNDTANTVYHLRRKRTLLPLALPHEMGKNTNRTRHFRQHFLPSRPRPSHLSYLFPQKRHQHGSTLESLQNSCWRRPRRTRKGSSTREMKRDMNALFIYLSVFYILYFRLQIIHVHVNRPC